MSRTPLNETEKDSVISSWKAKQVSENKTFTEKLLFSGESWLKLFYIEAFTHASVPRITQI